MANKTSETKWKHTASLIKEYIKPCSELSFMRSIGYTVKLTVKENVYKVIDITNNKFVGYIQKQDLIYEALQRGFDPRGVLKEYEYIGYPDIFMLSNNNAYRKNGGGIQEHRMNVDSITFSI